MILHCRDAGEAEAIACREGVHLALRWPDAPMILESDCHSMVAKLRANVRDRSSIWQIIEEAQEVGGQLRRMELLCNRFMVLVVRWSPVTLDYRLQVVV